ncbi:MAG: MBL fold metallo-hydrolase [Hyphomicrobiales bacterium]|nr:MAG: MBL fold metallo-hydrolase [Hyphomicrobiales bacterium]
MGGRQDHEPFLRFFGASGGVTGSCFELDTVGGRVLVDCGLFQGSKTEKELNYKPFPFEARDIDAVVLTHAHIDHSGLLPKLVRAGFEGSIFATPPTADLCSVMLPDSGYIQEMEVRHLNKRNRRRGRKAVTPIYTQADAFRTMEQFRPVDYEQWVEVVPGLRARYWNAGHLLGSASAEIEIEMGEGADGGPLRLIFSGDIGPDNKLLQPDPEAPRGFDYLLCESTYGDTDRHSVSEKARREMLRREVEDAYREKGVLLIPSFAIERTQELFVDLNLLMEAGEIPRMPVHIDSPLARRATQVFRDHADELERGQALLRALAADNIQFTESVEESIALDDLEDFHIVIAASGMCDAGRIRHRLKNWLWRDEATVLLVGYQAQGTLGRILLEGAKRVRIQGQEINVHARIRSIDLYSGHADAPELSAWVRERMPIRQAVFLVHGEEEPVWALKQRLEGFVDADLLVPRLDDAFRLTRNGALPVEVERTRRIEPEKTGRRDWHNEVSELLLDLHEQLDKAGDEKARAVIIRRVRKALDEVARD